MIDKWTEKQAVKNNIVGEWASVPIEEKNKIISKITTTRFMKLLYFTCLESVRSEFENAKNNSRDFDIENTLFSNFNNWIAYANGPVEQSIYDHKEQLYTICKGEKFQYKQNPEKSLPEWIADEGLSEKIKMIETSINSLTNFSSIPFDTDEDVEKLIWISHGELWQIAQWGENKKMFIDDPYLLGLEIKKFDERVKRLVA